MSFVPLGTRHLKEGKGRHWTISDKVYVESHCKMLASAYKKLMALRPRLMPIAIFNNLPTSTQRKRPDPSLILSIFIISLPSVTADGYFVKIPFCQFDSSSLVKNGQGYSHSGASQKHHAHTIMAVASAVFHANHDRSL